MNNDKQAICKCCDNPIKHYERVKNIKNKIYCESCYYQLTFMANWQETQRKHNERCNDETKSILKYIADLRQNKAI